MPAIIPPVTGWTNPIRHVRHLSRPILMIDVSHHINSAVQAVLIPPLNQCSCRPVKPKKPHEIVKRKYADSAADRKKMAKAFG